MNLKKTIVRYIARKPVKKCKDISRTIFLRDDGIGDLLIMLPFLYSFKNIHPSSEIILVVGERNFDLVKNFKNIKVVLKPKRAGILFFGYYLRFIEGDVILFDFFYRRWTQMLLFYFSLKPVCVMGFKKEDKRNLKSEWLKNFSSSLELDKEVTFFENYRRFLEKILGTPLPKKEYLFSVSFTFPVPVQLRVASLLKRLGEGKVIFINLEGSDSYRKFSIVSIQNLIDRLASFKKLKFIFSAEPNYLKKIKKSVGHEYENIFFMYDGLEILDVMAMVKQSDLVVSVDTSVIHMASLYNKDTIGIYIQDRHVDKLFFPYSDKYKIIWSPYLDQMTDNHIEDLSRDICKAIIDMVYA